MHVFYNTNTTTTTTTTANNNNNAGMLLEREPEHSAASVRHTPSEVPAFFHSASFHNATYETANRQSQEPGVVKFEATLDSKNTSLSSRSTALRRT